MKRTENVGTVTSILPGNIIHVKLDSGLGHIPIPAEALEPENMPSNDAPLTATATRPAKPASPPPPPPVKAKKSNTVSKATLHENNGVQLAFDPQLNNEAEPVAYEVYLINSTDKKIIYEVKTMTGSSRRWTKSGLIEANGKKRLEAVEYRWLNEKLTVELDVRAVLTGGTGPRHFQKLSIKPSQFFGKYVDVPELFRESHLYPVFPDVSARNTAPATAPPKTQSLKAMTQAAIAKKPKPPAAQKIDRTDIQEQLDFDEVLDLHLDNLVDDPTSVPKHQVLQLQLKTFDAYLERALKVGVDSIIVIHGVGNGVLKRAIHSRLHHTKFIRDFKNEYHHKYGFGATEIIFD